MRGTRRKTQGGFARPGIILSVLVVATWVLSGPALAKKPVKPPPEPPAQVDVGTIYYVSGGLKEMEPDGSDATALSSAIEYWAEPSASTHDGRWFLQAQAVADATYPAPSGSDALPRLEIFAVHESGSPVVQLTDGRIDDRTFIEPNQYYGGGVGETSCVMRWADGDTLVSYTAVLSTYDTSGNRTVLDGGIYALSVDPDALSDHVSTAMSGYPLLSLDLNPDETRVLAQSYDWKPDGSAIVFPNHHDDVNPGVWIAWASDEFATPTLLMSTGTHLRWSPNGSRILFKDGGIYSIKVDGTDRQLIVEDPADSKQTTVSVEWPSWSPSGTHVAYTLKKFTVRKMDIDLSVRVAAVQGDDLGEISQGSLARWRK